MSRVRRSGTSEPPGGTSAEITGVAIPGEVNGTAKFPAHSDEETTFHA